MATRVPPPGTWKRTPDDLPVPLRIPGGITRCSLTVPGVPWLVARAEARWFRAAS